jgi:hypothetical protein
MSKVSKPRKSRAADLEAKIAELEAKLESISSQMHSAPAAGSQISQTRASPAEMRTPPPSKSTWRSKGAGYEGYSPGTETYTAPKPEPKPAPRTKRAPEPEVFKAEMPEPLGEVSPAYATISSTGYTGNRYFATRARLAYHPPNKQFRGGETIAEAPTPEPPKPKPKRGTLPAGFKP